MRGTLLFLGAFLSAFLVAAQPANDECANAEIIVVGTASSTLVSFDNGTATQSLQSSCESASFTYLDVWYEFNMPVNGNLRFTNIDFADGFTLYDNCGAIPTEIDCFFDDKFIYNLTIGTYTLRVSSRDIYAGSDSFRIQAFETAANNECANAELITDDFLTSSLLINFNNAEATQSLQSSCETPSNTYLDLWYQFDMPVNGNLRFTNIDFADGFTLYDNCGTIPTEIDCFFDDHFVYNLAIGTYTLRVSSRAIYAGTDSFRMQAFETATNDECANAEIIPDDLTTATTINFNNAQATQSLQSSCETPSNTYLDLWYQITMPVNGNLRFTGIDFADGFTLYDTCGSIPTEIDCFFDDKFSYGLTTGNYILRVSSRAIYAGSDSVTIQAFAAAANDECANAEVIPDDITTATTINFNNAQATQSLQSSCESASNTYLDLWYQFDMPVNGNLRFTGIDFADGFTLYDNCAAIPTEIDCFYDDTFVYNLAMGTYTLRVTSRSIHAGADSFTMQAFETAVNDECANAIIIPDDITTATTINFNNAQATQSLQSSCESSSNTYLDLWYQFDMPVAGNLFFSGINFTDGFTLYDNCGTIPTEIDCFYDDNYVYNLPMGTYTLRVTSRSIHAGSDSFTMQAYETNVNDECANAIPIQVAGLGDCSSQEVTVNLRGSNIASSIGSCLNASQVWMDAWYTFEAPLTGNISLNTNSSFDHFVVYDACAGTEITCFSSDGVIPVTFGNTYTLQVAKRDNLANQVTFCLEGAPIVAPGIVGACDVMPTVEISTAQGNTNQWVPILDTSGNIVAAIDANGNDLGNVDATLFIENADTRSFSGQPYLRREVSLSTANAPSTNVSVRIYVLEDEVADLMLVDANLSNVNQLELMKVSGSGCTSGYTSGGNFINASTIAYNADYYLYFSTNSFSVFYPTSTNLSSTLSIDDVTGNQLGITVVPTVSNGIIQLKSYETISNLNLIVYDMMGRKVYATAFNQLSNTFETLDLKHLESGMYFINMNTATKKMTQRIIIK